MIYLYSINLQLNTVGKNSFNNIADKFYLTYIASKYYSFISNDY